MWCAGNERDHLGANLVPDFLTSVQDGGFYGWPLAASASGEAIKPILRISQP